MSLLLTLIAIAVSLLLFAARRRMGYWQRRGIPHDVPHPFFGNIKDWSKTRHIAKIFRDYYLKYKGSDYPFAGFFFFFTRTAVITDLELVKRVMIKDFNHFENRGVFYNEIDDPLSATLFSIEGQKWRHLRHKLTPTFTSGKMKHMFPINMFPTVLNVGEELIRVFDEKISSSSSPQTLEVTNLLARFTADVIGVCAFGLKCNSLRNPNAEFVRMGESALNERRHGKLVDMLLFGAPRLSAKLGIKTLLQPVADFYMNIVKDTIEYRIKNKVSRIDFMDMLIEMKLKYDSGNKEEGLTFNEIAAQAFIFFLAGFERSSTTMGFALFELASNPDVQDKLRADIDGVLKRHNGKLDYDSMRVLTYLEKVIDETLRKHPVVAHLVRMTTKPYAHSNPKYSIDRDIGVLVPTLGIHHDPEFYPEPEKFIPERFDEEQVKQRPACTFLPFGDGPRNCIGLRFGRMQVIVGMALLIHNYKFELHPTKTSVPIKYKVKNILLSAEGGIILNVSKMAKN
ncbi:hypothetical protein KR059_012640 [Drosophila kikkawai]|nr:hypothetical protein KR059_012640 [Drosophila kikkawai]